MKHILIINNAAIGGGVETVMLNLVNYLILKQDKVTVFTEFNEYDFYDVYPKEVKYLHLSVPNRNRFPEKYDSIKHKGLRKKLESKARILSLNLKKYDVVIAIKEGNSMVIASKIKSGKKIGWVHVDYRYLYWTKSVFGSKQAEREFMKKNFEKIVCVSEATAEGLKGRIGDPENICVRYNPVNYRTILAKSNEKSQFVKPEGKLLFVAAGRLTEQKNFLMLADVCIELSKKYDFELWIIGNGPQKEEIEKKLENAKCDSVKLLGFLNNPYPVIRMADWFVSSAVWETYGLAIQEAFILGVPVITTKCPAIVEVFDQRFGKMVDCDDKSLGNAMEEVLTNLQIREHYSSKIEKYYNINELWDSRLEKICSLWME